LVRGPSAQAATATTANMTKTAAALRRRELKTLRPQKSSKPFLPVSAAEWFIE